ncbi:MAG: carboxypeptidase regulatory-like domain-containing protein, partial [Oceanihabitans sp.]|nr:carboxypeptidase regulatory-like domain-containing protein [Oceanihabitans sp.]
MKNRNTKSKLLLSLILVIGILFTSCDPKDVNESYEPGENNEIGLDLGQSVQHDFMGRIVDESNAPIENVMVSIGSKMESTDANGLFIISNANVKKRQAFIIAEKPGYLKGMQSLVPTQGTNTVRLMLIPQNVIATISSGGDSEVNLPNGTTVKFDGAFKEVNGNDYSGNIDVIMYHLDPSNPDIDAIMPGNLQ